jgi:hypothetical protein
MKKRALLAALLTVTAGNLFAASPMNPMQAFYQRAKETYGQWRAACELQKVQRRLNEDTRKLYGNLRDAILKHNKKLAFQILDAAEHQPQGEGNVYWSNLRFTPTDIFYIIDDANRVSPEFAKELLARNDNALAALLMREPQKTESLIHDYSILAPETTNLLAKELGARNFKFSRSLADKALKGEFVEREVLGTPRPVKITSNFKANQDVARIINRCAASYDHSDNTLLLNPLQVRKTRLIE